MPILKWDKPKKVMSRTEWESVTADGAPPGVYVPNMSDADARTFRAKKIGGKDPRIEIRVTLGAQIKIVVRPGPMTVSAKHPWQLDGVMQDVTISTNGRIDMSARDWMHFVQAVWEAKDILHNEKEKQNA